VGFEWENPPKYAHGIVCSISGPCCLGSVEQQPVVNVMTGGRWQWFTRRISL